MIPNSSVAIYSFFYKPGKIPIDADGYIPLMAGKALLAEKIDIPGDDLFDSISEKNRYFSELTGLYWVWKNTSHSVVGSCHYRRYFCSGQEPFLYRLKRGLYYFAGLSKKRYGLIYTKNVHRFQSLVLNETKVKEILSQYDIILPQARKMKYTIREHYHRYHHSSDLELLHSLICEMHPEFVDTFNRVMDGKRLYANNMFVMNRIDFDPCMEWLFGLLFEFEKRVNLANYHGYQQRLLGFLAERLLTVWFVHHQFRAKELPVIYFKHLKYNS